MILTREIYEKGFTEAGIPYRIEDNKGLLQIVWNQKYGIQVDYLREELDKKIYATNKEKWTLKANSD